MMSQFILQVLLGRATEGVPVDIDLGKGGHGNAISRRQVSYVYQLKLKCQGCSNVLLHLIDFG